MGSRGSFLESGGFSTPAKWHTVDYVDGIKVLAPKDSKASISLPERSNTPGTAYISYRKDGNTIPDPPNLKKGDPLYEKHKHLFKGVK